MKKAITAGKKTLERLITTNLSYRCAALLMLSAVTLFFSCKKQSITNADTVSLSNAATPKLKTQSTVVKYLLRDKTTSVTTLDGEPGYDETIVYTVGPFNVDAGDVVTVHLQRQFGLNGVAPVMVAGGVVAGTSATCYDNTQPGYIAHVIGFAGSNLTAADRGREVITRTGSYQFTTAATGVYLNAVFYAQAITVSGGSGDITLPAGNYGELVALVQSGVTWQQTQLSALTYNSSEGAYEVPFTPVLNVHNSIGPVTVPANSIAEVRYDAEASTNPTPSNPYQTYGRNIIEGSSATATTGTNMTKQTQVGITHSEHHSTWSEAGAYTTGATAVGNAYFNSVVYSNGWEGDYLYLHKGSSRLYNRMALEIRPNLGFNEDNTNNISTVTGTPQVLYSVGPLNITAGEIYELRYQAAFSMTAWCTLDAEIVRASSPTATTGTLVQNPLAHGFDPSYYRSNITNSELEQIPTTATGQYYNVVVWTIQGSTSVTAQTWGELEVIKRQ